MLVLSGCSNKTKDFSEDHIKVVLREVGNQLLLVNRDSTSLVLPVLVLDESRYRLSFQKQLSFEPNDLVSIFRENFQRSKLSKDYSVEVVQCKDEEVAYSYEVSANEENTIIPCSNRILPKQCYTIEVRLIQNEKIDFNNTILLVVLALVGLPLLALLLYRRNYKVENSDAENVIRIGSFKFYAEQNKLIKEAEEISLSKKECELLEIFVSRPNEVIKRDELTKRVWEDNGVFVGRSLDTYISKLRKKLKGDDSIKLTNVHGVGYKLELK